MGDRTPDWKLPPDADDWECDWESSRRFQLNYWAALPLREQLKAVKEMGRLVEKLAPPDCLVRGGGPDPESRGS